VGDLVLRQALAPTDFAGLDTAVEIFAVDAEPEPGPARRGRFWAPAFRGAPPLDAPTVARIPEEGGFLVRPILPPDRGDASQLQGALVPGPSRIVLAPDRATHADLGFPAPTLVSNEIFAEIRYAMAPSLVRWLDFDDIRDGILRIFAFPGFEGDVRVVTVVDEAAVVAILAESVAKETERKRLLQFLHAAAAAPPAARWLTSAEASRGEEEEEAPAGLACDADLAQLLFPHQSATLRWMRRMEQIHLPSESYDDTLRIEPISFAGIELGTPTPYQVTLPRGGVVAHPPGAGKTRIATALLRCGAGAEGPRSLIICPAHLREQWDVELEFMGTAGAATVVDYESVGPAMRGGQEEHRWLRVILDEPQDCPAGDPWKDLQDGLRELRTSRVPLWLLCGTAQDHLDTIGSLLLGRIGWHVASKQSEWRGCPQLPHITRSRFIADPPWACLPMPPLEVDDVPIILRQRESANAAVASLAGFVIDGVLLLSYGAEAAFAAAQERDELLLQMGWHDCVGTALLPVTEHALQDWEGAVVRRSREKLVELVAEIAALEQEEQRHAARYQFAGGDAAAAPDLAFLAREAARVEVDGLQGGACVVEEACTAEWNALVPVTTVSGRLFAGGDDHGASDRVDRIALLHSPADGDFATAATAAGIAGASAVVFEADRDDPRPFGYSHDQAPPTVLAAMISRTLAARIRASLGAGAGPSATLSMTHDASDEAQEEIDEGLLSRFIADDVVEDQLHRRLKSLREERVRCERALRFAKQMRALLERNEASCPVCFHRGDEVGAFAVMPDCFHVLCKACLDRQAGIEHNFACPMCRVNVTRLDVVVFRAPGGCGGGGVAQAHAPVEDAAPESRLDADGAPISRGEVVPETEAPQCEEGAAGEEGEDASLERELPPPAVDHEASSIPSKLEHLVALLHELLGLGEEERVLVYTQWVAHVAHLQQLLACHGLPTLALVGDLRETMDALSRFGRPDEPRVLLLSSQRHSAGINLQAARHIVIIHPYCTPTASSQESISRSQMLSYEAQAIGRVRRYPQQRPVKVYRFFAAGTVEEELYAGR